MKKNSGVTLTSLTIYIIVLVVVLVLLTFITSNYTSQIADATDKGRISNEIIKLYSFIISDIKSSNKIVEFSDDYVKFENDAKYTIKYLGSLSDKDREVKQYEIYRDNVLISENIMDASFDYKEEDNLFTVKVKYIYGKSIIDKEQAFTVGRGY